jgi:hypothetical protein
MKKSTKFKAIIIILSQNTNPINLAVNIKTTNHMKTTLFLKIKKLVELVQFIKYLTIKASLSSSNSNTNPQLSNSLQRNLMTFSQSILKMSSEK